MDMETIEVLIPFLPSFHAYLAPRWYGIGQRLVVQ